MRSLPRRDSLHRKYEPSTTGGAMIVHTLSPAQRPASRGLNSVSTDLFRSDRHHHSKFKYNLLTVMFIS
jgi:hypothetical protein